MSIITSVDVSNPTKRSLSIIGNRWRFSWDMSVAAFLIVSLICIVTGSLVIRSPTFVAQIFFTCSKSCRTSSKDPSKGNSAPSPASCCRKSKVLTMPTRFPVSF
eukprot:347371_1